MPPTAGRALPDRIDVRAIVECLLTAHYSDTEVFEYLVGPLGLPEADAFAGLEAVRGPGRRA